MRSQEGWRLEGRAKTVPPTFSPPPALCSLDNQGLLHLPDNTILLSSWVFQSPNIHNFTSSIPIPLSPKWRTSFKRWKGITYSDIPFLNNLAYHRQE